MAAITSNEARAYFARWEMVREFETAELWRTTTDTKLRQLSALMAASRLFGTNPNCDRGVQAVRERWARVIAAAGSH